MHELVFRQKLAEIEADLVSASIHGDIAFVAEMQSKIAGMDLDADDVEAILEDLTQVREISEKLAFSTAAMPGAVTGLGRLSANAGKLLNIAALGTVVGAPLLAGAKFFSQRRAKDEAWDRVVTHHPEMVATDPQRARAVFDLLHSTAPNVAQNTPVAGDLMKQMLAMPMLDLGTTASLARMGKDMQPHGGAQSNLQNAAQLQSLSGAFKGAHALLTSRAVVPVVYRTADKVACVFDWGNDVMKTAGITDAFMGGGLPIEQADNGTSMNQRASGMSLLPLDAVIRELLAKEQELAQREDVIAQREAALAQAEQSIQQMGHMYQDQTGVSPQGAMQPEPEAMPPEPPMDPAADAQQADAMAPAGEPEAPVDQTTDAALGLGEEAPVEEAPPGEEAPLEEAPVEEAPPVDPEASAAVPTDGEAPDDADAAANSDAGAGDGAPLSDNPMAAADDVDANGAAVEGDENGEAMGAEDGVPPAEGGEAAPVDPAAAFAALPPPPADGSEPSPASDQLAADPAMAEILSNDESAAPETGDANPMAAAGEEPLAGEDPAADSAEPVGAAEGAEEVGVEPAAEDSPVAGEDAPVDGAALAEPAPEMDAGAGDDPGAAAVAPTPDLAAAAAPVGSIAPAPVAPSLGITPQEISFPINLPTLTLSIKLGEHEDPLEQSRKDFEATIGSLFRP